MFKAYQSDGKFILVLYCNPFIPFNGDFVASKRGFIQVEHCLLYLNSSPLLFSPPLRDEMEKDLKKLKVGDPVVALWFISLPVIAVIAVISGFDT